MRKLVTKLDFIIILTKEFYETLTILSEYMRTKSGSLNQKCLEDVLLVILNLIQILL